MILLMQLKLSIILETMSTMTSLLNSSICFLFLGFQIPVEGFDMKQYFGIFKYL